MITIKFSVSIFMLFMFVAAGLRSQNTYQKIFDNPDEVTGGHIAIEYFAVDAGLKNTSGAILMAVGIDGYYPVTSRLGVEAFFRFPLLRLENHGSAYLIDGGGEFKFASFTREKEEKVLLHYSESTNYLAGYRYINVKYVPLSGKVKRNIGVRGGGYFHQTSYETDEYYTNYTTITHNGIYMGLSLERLRFFQVKHIQSGYKFASAVSIKFYADLLLLNTKFKENVEKKSENIGYRIGLKWYNNPFKKEQNFNSGKGFFGNMFVSAEIGSRPAEGFFATGSVGWIVKKFD